MKNKSQIFARPPYLCTTKSAIFNHGIMKKKIIIAALTGICVVIGIFSFAANQKTSMDAKGKKLVVFFSRTGENYNVGMIKKGNTSLPT